MGGMFVTTNISYAIGDSAAWMPHSKWCVSLVSCAMVAGLGWIAVRGLSLGKWVHNIGGFAMLRFMRAHRTAVHRTDARRFEGISSARPRRADHVALLLHQHFHQTRRRRPQRIRIRRDSRRRNALPGAQHWSLGHYRVTGDRAHVHSRHQFGARLHRRQTDRSHRPGAANAAARACVSFRSQAPSLPSPLF